jgi:integrase
VTIPGAASGRKDAAGLNDSGKGWHSFRHTYARICLESGVTMEDLHTFLGHASITVTEKVYGHLRPSVAATRARGKLYPSGGPQLVG